ncbi:MAG: hypothetical protein ACI92E_001461, partial [Oceanicoccus sp.]
TRKTLSEMIAFRSCYHPCYGIHHNAPYGIVFF